MDRPDALAAITARHAVRHYLATAVPPEVRAELDATTARLNVEYGLAMRLFYEEPEGFRGGLAHYGSFRGVRNYLLLAGSDRPGLATTCGYAGEQVVLLAQHLGLNSCWVGLTYNKRKAHARIGPDDTLVLAVALGYGVDAGKPHRSKPLDELGRVQDGGTMPDWFRSGLEAVALAPSGLNHQGTTFVLAGDVVRAEPGRGTYARIDLGIAMFHFEAGAQGGPWRWETPVAGGH